MGVVGEDYGNHALPGWLKGTVGYHIDEGKIFDANNPTKGREYEGKEKELKKLTWRITNPFSFRVNYR